VRVKTEVFWFPGPWAVQQCDHLTLDDIHACLAYEGEVSRTEQVFAVKG
jgi:hypothetical protein